jgi:hypothetical protein
VGNGGGQQKLALARALLHRPPLVLLDEPTAGLDVPSAAAVRENLAKLAEREGTTVFLTTHNMAEAEKLCSSLPIALGSLALSFLMALLTAGAGVFVSLRVATAQEAAQILTFATIIPPVLLQLVPFLFREQMQQFLDRVNGPQLLLIVLVVLLVLDVAVLLAAVARFRRSRLIA